MRRPGRVVLTVALAAGLAACDQSSKTAASLDAGKSVFQAHCVACHRAGAAGAPRVGNDNRLAWSEEIEEDGFRKVVAEAIRGKGAMPPRGGCDACSDQDIENAVLYMLKLSSAK